MFPVVTPQGFVALRGSVFQLCLIAAPGTQRRRYYLLACSVVCVQAGSKESPLAPTYPLAPVTSVASRQPINAGRHLAWARFCAHAEMNRGQYSPVSSPQGQGEGKRVHSGYVQIRSRSGQREGTRSAVYVPGQVEMKSSWVSGALSSSLQRVDGISGEGDTHGGVGKF